MSKSFESKLDEYRKQIAQGEFPEQVITNLHLKGFTILEAIKTVKRLYELSLKEAQSRVMEHPKWKDEASKVLLLEDIVRIVEADPLYYAWLDWYTAGVHRLGMAQITTRAYEREREIIKERIITTANANEETQLRLLEKLADQPHESLDALLPFVSNYSRYTHEVVELALRTIHAIGYPSNANATRWLVYLAIDPDAPGRTEAIQTLLDMNVDEVIPYFLAVLINDNPDKLKWGMVITNVCQIIMENAVWIQACGPTIANLLSQHQDQRENQPDPAILLSALEWIMPECSYAIPAIYQLALQAKGSELGEKAQSLLLLFDEGALKPYQYHLRMLLDDAT